MAGPPWSRAKRVSAAAGPAPALSPHRAILSARTSRPSAFRASQHSPAQQSSRPPAGSDAENFAAYFGESALRRFDRDAAAQPGAEHVIVLLGVNDLGHPGTVAPESERVSAQDIIDAHRQIIARAHERGLTVYGGTILPFKNDTLGFYSPGNGAARQTVNHWIRTSGAYDGVIDFDKALRDPADPQRLLARYDGGDHLHPNDAGAEAMADAIPLHLLR
ncbi:GDSL-type esterase/lipase family protein [Streptomyces sp. NBC_00316]|uniref:GDSL-type esterase/lipase family protein n=1 Tax=Streptomyces sp. NBC_00316 TaxID=2975710 RepID=UPI002E287C30|nr:GDSL-type esterase/lipase family protein [Streptomyces sp. NBC_00316]